MLYNSFSEINTTLKSKANSDGLRKENYISFSLMHLDVKTLKWKWKSLTHVLLFVTP